MKILPYRRKQIAKNVYVNVSQHYHHSDFGVRSHNSQHQISRRYIGECTPGTGFFERNSDSNTYRLFVQKEMKKSKASYWRMLCEREPSFNREIKAVKMAVKDAVGVKKEILECYLNALSIGKEAEEIQRMTEAVKKKIKHHSRKLFVSILGYLRNKLGRLEEDMYSVQYNVVNTCSEERYEAYCQMVDVFNSLSSSRRVWFYNPDSKQAIKQVQFDMGVFDYVYSPVFLPLLRDGKGNSIYILPNHIIVAKSSTDFVVMPLNSVSFVANEVALEENVYVLGPELSDVAATLYIPELNQTYYFNHYHIVEKFVNALDKLKDTP